VHHSLSPAWVIKLGLCNPGKKERRIHFPRIARNRHVFLSCLYSVLLLLAENGHHNKIRIVRESGIKEMKTGVLYAITRKISRTRNTKTSGLDSSWVCANRPYTEEDTKLNFEIINAIIIFWRGWILQWTSGWLQLWIVYVHSHGGLFFSENCRHTKTCLQDWALSFNVPEVTGISAGLWWASTTAARHSAPGPDRGTPQWKGSFPPQKKKSPRFGEGLINKNVIFFSNSLASTICLWSSCKQAGDHGGAGVHDAHRPTSFMSRTTAVELKIVMKSDFRFFKETRWLGSRLYRNPLAG